MTSHESTHHDDSRTAEQGNAGAHDLKSVLEELEHDLILKALRESNGNKAKAARALGITERLMGIRVQRLRIDWRELRTRRKNSAERTPNS